MANKKKTTKKRVNKNTSIKNTTNNKIVDNNTSVKADINIKTNDNKVVIHEDNTSIKNTTNNKIVDNNTSVKNDINIETNDNKVIIHEDNNSVKSNDIVSHEEKVSIVIPPKEKINTKEEIPVKKKRKIFTIWNIILFCIILLIIVILLMVLFGKGKRKMTEFINDSNLNISEDLTFDDKNGTIASKYNIDISKLYKGSDKVMLGDYEGVLLYIRYEEMNANIFQSYLNISTKIDGVPTLIIMSETMKSFEEKCLNELDIPTDIEMKESYYGESSYKFKLSPEESILNDGREYSKSFVYNDVKYDINYYINDNNMVCEFVRFL